MTQIIDGNVKKEKLLRKCESLVLQGYSTSEISEKLRIARNTVRSYLQVIHERWGSEKNTQELQLRRQEIVKKMEEVVRECWKLKEKARNVSERTGLLRTALASLEAIAKLEGINTLPIMTKNTNEVKIFEFAQEIHELPSKRREIVLKRVREEKFKRRKQKQSSLAINS